jgi:predicted secreted protein
MGIIASIVTFFLVWWIVLFAVLPFAAKQPDTQEVGMMPGAPVKPDFKKIIMRTTVASIFIWTIIFALAQSDLVSFRRWAWSEGAEQSLMP